MAKFAALLSKWTASTDFFFRQLFIVYSQSFLMHFQPVLDISLTMTKCKTGYDLTSLLHAEMSKPVIPQSYTISFSSYIEKCPLRNKLY